MNIRPETIKLLEGSKGDKLLESGLGNYFFLIGHQKQRPKSKNKQVRQHQTKKPIQGIGRNQQNEKAVHQMGENICKLHI